MQILDPSVISIVKSSPKNDVKISFIPALPSNLQGKNYNAEVLGQGADGKFLLKLEGLTKPVNAEIFPPPSNATKLQININQTGETAIVKQLTLPDGRVITPESVRSNKPVLGNVNLEGGSQGGKSPKSLWEQVQTAIKPALGKAVKSQLIPADTQKQLILNKPIILEAQQSVGKIGLRAPVDSMLKAPDTNNINQTANNLIKPANSTGGQYFKIPNIPGKAIIELPNILPKGSPLTVSFSDRSGNMTILPQQIFPTATVRIEPNNSLLNFPKNSEFTAIIKYTLTGGINNTVAQIPPQKALPNLSKPLELMVKSSIEIPTGSGINMKINADGMVDVIRIEPPTKQQAIQARTDQKGNSGQNGVMGDKGQVSTSKPADQSLTVGAKITGTVVAQTDGLKHTIKLENGQQIEVKATKQLPVGAKLAVEIMADGKAKILSISVPETTTQAQKITELSRSWVKLNQGIETLREQSPTIATSLINKLPNGNNFLPSILNFAYMVAKEDPTRVISDDTLAVLRSIGIDLSPDISQLNQLLNRAEGLPDGWRGLIFPFMPSTEGMAQQGSLFWRQQKGGKDNDKKSTRLVMQAELSHIGAFQLDGLIHPDQLLMRLRVRKQLGETFIAGLQNIVGEALTNLKISGGITVEVTDEFPTNAVKDLLQSYHPLNVTI